MNIEIIKRPYTLFSVPYFEDGVRDGDIEMSLDPVDNPIVFGLASESTGVVGNKSKVILNVNVTPGSVGVIGDGAFFTIFGEFLTAKTNPNSANEWLAGDTSVYAREISISLADTINSNLNLSWRVYATAIVTSGNNWGVFVTSKFRGSDYDIFSNITLGSSLQGVGSANFALNQVTGTDSNRGERLQEYRYGCFVRVLTSENPIPFGRKAIPAYTGYNGEPLGTLIKKWNSKNEFYFDISEFLRDQLELFTPVFFDAQLNSNLTYVKNQIKSYALEYGEVFNGGYDPATGDPAESPGGVEQKFVIATTDVRWATHGAYVNGFTPSYNERKWANWWSSNTFQPGGRNIIDFLNSAPEEVTRRRNNQRFNNSPLPYLLYVLLWNDQQFSEDRQYRLWYQHTLLDGTELSEANLAPITVTTNSGVYYVNASYANLGLNTIEADIGKVLFTKYKIEQNLNGTWTDYTRTKTWCWDINQEESDRYTRLFWRNNDGQLSQFDFEGQRIEELDFDNDFYERSRDFKEFFDVDSGQRQVFNKEGRVGITVNSGLVDKETLFWLKELRGSGDVYIPVSYKANKFNNNPDGYDVRELGELTKVNVVDFDWEFNTEEKLYNVEVQIEYSFLENYRKA